jgi:uncharacterized membrane protein YfcA
MTPPEIGSGDDGAGDGRAESAAPVSRRPEITQAPATATMIGLIGGGLSALLGVGGGIVMVPAMAYLLRVRPHRAHGTSLAVMIPVAIAGVFRYHRAGNVAWGLVIPLAVGSVLGALIGGTAANAMRGSVLKTLLGVLVVATGFAMMMVRAVHAPAAALGASAALIGAVGLAAGAVSGLLGAGGGIVMVPAVVFLLGQDQHVAQGVSLAVIVPVSAFGTWIHARHGNVIPTLAFWLAVGGVIGALGLGAVVQGLSSALLRALFGIFLVIVGLTMVTRQSPGRAG